MHVRAYGVISTDKINIWNSVTADIAGWHMANYAY